MTRPRKFGHLQGRAERALCGEDCRWSRSKFNCVEEARNALCERCRCYGWTFKRATKKPNRRFDSAFKVLPRRCRLGGYPVPFGNGRMTVARASDFQLRRAIFPKTRPSLLS